jgi:hypothetical protein
VGKRGEEKRAEERPGEKREEKRSLVQIIEGKKTE